MIRDYIYFMPIIISITGILSLDLSLKNKDRDNNKLIIIFNIINIFYLFVISAVIHNILPIIVDLILMLTWLISIIGGIFYLISTIICICKRSKLNNDIRNKGNLNILIIIMVIPIIIFALIMCKELYLINSSELILKYNSAGNGGFGDSDDFVYVVCDKYCTEVSVDVDLAYKYYKIFLPKKIKVVTEDELLNKGFKVEIVNSYINVYKNQELIHNKKINEDYFNIKLKSIYYNE